jgi:hypothetical protein
VKNPNVTLKSVENTDVDLTELISKKKNSFSFFTVVVGALTVMLI